MRYVLSALIVVMGAVRAEAHLQTERIEYRHEDAVLEGLLAYTQHDGKHPAVLVVHEWKGLGPYAEGRAKQLAELGYVAFAVDMYGKGVRAETHEEAAKLSGTYRSDRQLMRARIRAALEVLQRHPLVDPARIAAIGYCFGGTTVLELARSGAEIAGVASFHGGLGTPLPAEAGQVRGKVLVLHGADDPFVTAEEVAAFEQEMQDAGADYRLIRYSGAVHSFTVPEAGNDPSKGMAHHPEADQRSWEELTRFLQQIFQSRESLHAARERQNRF